MAHSMCSTWSLRAPMSRTRVSELMARAGWRYYAWLVAAAIALALWIWFLFDSSSKLTQSRVLDFVQRWIDVRMGRELNPMRA